MESTELQKRVLALQAKLIDIQAKLAEGTEFTPNADEIYIVANDLAAKAANAATDLASDALNSVGEFLDNLFDG